MFQTSYSITVMFYKYMKLLHKCQFKELQRFPSSTDTLKGLNELPTDRRHHYKGTTRQVFMSKRRC